METKGNCYTRGKIPEQTASRKAYSSLRSHEIELKKDMPKKKSKSLALKSREMKTNSKVLQVAEESDESKLENQRMKSCLTFQEKIWTCGTRKENLAQRKILENPIMAKIEIWKVGQKRTHMLWVLGTNPHQS